ncbi:anti-sigma factor domain-containing protein [Chitinophagaceae bacterium LWZ2-11]
MNIQEYISSGIIESYVLGLADELEVETFEQLSSKYPELVSARKTFEIMLERHAVANAVEPPAYIKEEIFRIIQKGPDIHQHHAPVKQLYKEQPRKKNGMRYMAAASIILLAVCGYLLYQLSSQNNKLKNANSNLLAKYNSGDSILNKIISAQTGKKDSGISVVNMVTPSSLQSEASIYWDSASSNVYLIVKNLPKLPADKQYQLWALIDGKPKDLGVFDATDDRVILKMKNTKKAEAFSITVEKKGGNTVPSGDKIKASGKTS